MGVWAVVRAGPRARRSSGPQAGEPGTERQLSWAHTLRGGTRGPSISTAPTFFAVTHQSPSQVPEGRAGLVDGAFRALRFCQLTDLSGHLRKQNVILGDEKEAVFSISTENRVWKVRSRGLWD